MPNYRRWYVEGGTYFFTVVTHYRRPILTTELGRRCLRRALSEVRERRPFRTLASVLLPEYLHSVWVLPKEDARYSLRHRKVKERFTGFWLAGGGDEAPVSPSRKRKGERGVWQRRFWEHTCQDWDDVKRCVDYIHWNPKKHGLVRQVVEWPYSSFKQFVAAGEYPIDWGSSDPCPGWDVPEV